MLLAAKLTKLRNASAKRFLPEIKAQMKRATIELRASSILDTALKAGDKIPEFALPNTNGETVNSKDLLDKGNLVVIFYRGVW